MIKNDKTRNIFIIILGWWILSIVMSIIGELLKWSVYKDSIRAFVLAPIGCCIAFSPTILLLHFLFKKKENKYVRVLMTAFLIPFTNMIYFYFTKLIGAEVLNDFSMLLGFFTVFAAIPIAFVTSLCLPKSILPFKWYIILTNILMEIFAWIMIFICLLTYPIEI